MRAFWQKRVCDDSTILTGNTPFPIKLGVSIKGYDIILYFLSSLLCSTHPSSLEKAAATFI